MAGTIYDWDQWFCGKPYGQLHRIVVANSDSDDNEQQYTIDLTTEEQDVIYAL